MLAFLPIPFNQFIFVQLLQLFLQVLLFITFFFIFVAPNLFIVEVLFVLILTFLHHEHSESFTLSFHLQFFIFLPFCLSNRNMISFDSLYLIVLDSLTLLRDHTFILEVKLVNLFLQLLRFLLTPQQLLMRDLFKDRETLQLQA